MVSQVIWVNGESEVTNLNNRSDVWAVRGWGGFHDLPVVINSYDVPLQPGAAYSSTKLKSRDVDLPLFVVSRTRQEFLTKLRGLISAFNPDKGLGTLRIFMGDGTVRELYCRYLSGLEGDTAARGWTPGSALVVVTLRALDPFWYEQTAQELSFINTGASIKFFPFFPLRLAIGSIFETQIVANNGDHVAWPIWTIDGPGTTLQLSNETSGFSLTANLSLSLGDTVVIDTRPGYKTVRQGSSNLFYTLTETSVLWGLLRGNNSISILFDDSNADSQVRLSFAPPFLSV